MTEDIQSRFHAALPDRYAIERFLREIEIAAQLTHPHILPLHDSGEAGGFLYYAMPYIEGETLRGRIQCEKQLSFDDALQIRQTGRFEVLGQRLIDEPVVSDHRPVVVELVLRD